MSAKINVKCRAVVHVNDELETTTLDVGRDIDCLQEKIQVLIRLSFAEEKNHIMLNSYAFSSDTVFPP